ncbi:magnesium/cobalt transporter CorA [Rhizobacter sp. LjRoot28]|jgi:magnesium transporter|uniref:magnesium/cobalt transporter CorA n=1 Tax=Rhizobacter sp. LjRoot28 TaxID=3342309 RepID=UPI003ECD0028
MLINCVAYQEGRKVADIGPEAISDYLGRPGFLVWLALKDPTPDELKMIRDEFGLHELAIEDAETDHQRPKIEEYGDTVFAVAHTIEYGPTDDLVSGEVAIFAGPNFVISVRNRSEHSLQEVRERAEREPHLMREGPGFVLYALLDAIVDQYFPVIEALESELEGIEEKIFVGGSGKENVRRLYDLKRRIAVVRHAVMPLLDSVGHLTRGRVPPVCESSRHYFRDVYDHLARIDGELDNLRDTISTAIQVNLSMITIDEAETTKRLAAWAGIFALATVFAGIWGMNFELMPELRWRWGYPAALGVMGLSCAWLYRRFRKADWL